MIEMTHMKRLPDIKPSTPIDALQGGETYSDAKQFDLLEIAPIVGMSPQFIRRVIDHRSSKLSMNDVYQLLNLDAFSETFVPRSKIPGYLSALSGPTDDFLRLKNDVSLIRGTVPAVLGRLISDSVACVVTSSPYWGMRIYEDPVVVDWADGESCAFGHEQTPEGFIRHSVEVLHGLRRLLTEDGSIWWNVMDTYNTRTQIRSSAVEALNAMKGMDQRSWNDHECRRYSAGHSFLKDGELCHIPSRIAERASRIGYYVKSIVTWAKTSSLPEPQNSRVSRAMENIIHLTPTRNPKFDKSAYLELPEHLGGRNCEREVGKVSDVWMLPTSAGRDGHGAQFPLALPGRCIGLTTKEGDLVLDPFVGSGTSGQAAHELGRRFIGIDVSPTYLKVAEKRLGVKASH
jgi:DNA modification methylase